MKAFHLTAETAELFFEICHEFNAQTEAERTSILEAMVTAGQIGFVVETKKTKEEYIQHLSKKFGNVLRVSPSMGDLKGDTSNGNSSDSKQHPGSFRNPCDTDGSC